MWGYMCSYNGWWGFMGLGMMGMLLFWILIVVAIITLVKGMWGPWVKLDPVTDPAHSLGGKNRGA